MSIRTWWKNFRRPTLVIGDVWKLKHDGWEGKYQPEVEVVVMAFNLRAQEVMYVKRNLCEYNSKTKTLESKTNRHSYESKAKRTSISELKKKYSRTEDNFLEIDVLLGE